MSNDGSKRTEGSPPVRANLAPRPCIRLDPPGVRTMKQPCASAARLRGSGPILTTALPARQCVGLPPPRIVISVPPRQRSRMPKLYSCRQSSPGRSRCDRPHAHAVWDYPCRHHSPHRDEQLAREGDNHGGLARALSALGPGAIPLRQRAVLLEQKKPPGELDQAAAHPCIAGLGQALLAPLGPAFVWRAGQASIARHGPASRRLRQSTSWTSISAVST